MTEQIKQFLSEFVSNEMGIQIWKFVPFNNNWGCAFKILWDLSNLDEILKNETSSDIYFQTGTPNWFNRKAKLTDIVWKNSFFIDVDVRKNYKKNKNIIISDDELLTEIEKIKEGINQVEILKDRYSINFSGNGCHIRYIWNWLNVPSDISIEEYNKWVSSIYKMFEDLFCDQNDLLLPDYSCTSIEKLSRVVWTWNVSKRKDFWLEPIQSRILHFKWTKCDVF